MNLYNSTFSTFLPGVSVVGVHQQYIESNYLYDIQREIQKSIHLSVNLPSSNLEVNASLFSTEVLDSSLSITEVSRTS